MLRPKKNVLLTDDDDTVLDVMTIILEDAGYEVNHTRSGESHYWIRNNSIEFADHWTEREIRIRSGKRFES